jgi:pimeloyl-ACP methyl ester carboxylesterase
VITVIILQILLPIFIVFVLTMFLRIVGSFFMFSPRMRACHIFSKTSWLPLRYSEELPIGDEVEFLSDDGVLLRGLFLSSQNTTKHGTILFCHELNGNRSNIAPYANILLSEGFDIFTFDFRNHGKSDSYLKDYSVPWLTVADMSDVKAAIDYVCLRENDNDFCNENSQAYNSTDSIINNTGVRIFGLGKGAMIALCAAGSDSRVKSLVLDAPTTDSHLFKKNCWQALVKSVMLPRRLAIKRMMNFSILFLFFQAILYTLKQPIFLIYNTWQRYVLGMWYDCQFINIEPIIKKVRQPIMIVHGHVETKTRPNQIRAFCARMPQKPKLWLTTKHQKHENCESQNNTIKPISDDCQKSVADFFMQTT